MRRQVKRSELESFVQRCRERHNTYMRANYNRLRPGKIGYDVHGTWARIWLREKRPGVFGNPDWYRREIKTVFAFVDLKSGNLHRATNWNKVDSVIRGNLFDPDYGMASVTGYGVFYRASH